MVDKICYPLKFNHGLLEFEYFDQMIKEKWRSFDHSLGVSTMDQTSHILKELKCAIIDWEKTHKASMKEELVCETERGNGYGP